MSATITAELIENKRVLLRADLNLPTVDGEIVSLARWQKILPTINQILAYKPTKLIIASHYGQPKGVDERFSLIHIHKKIKCDLPDMQFIKEIKASDAPGKVFLLENVRFDHREKEVNNELINTYLTHVDTVVFDAFSVGHRPHASVCGLMLQAKSYVFGPLFEAEKKAIDQAMHGADPRLAIISGAKITSKLVVIKKMLAWADSVIVGGAIANTLLKAKGIDMGQSLIDHSALDIAEKLINTAGNKLILPIDGIDQDGCRHDFDAPLPGSTKLLDIGSKTCLEYAKYIDKAKTIIWNGPMGYYENPKFRQGTQAVALAVAGSQAHSIVGGGDSIAAINDLDIDNQFNYVSTSGGAFIHYIAHGSLPVLDAAQSNRIHANVEEAIS